MHNDAEGEGESQVGRGQALGGIWRAWGKRPFRFGLFAAAQLIVLTVTGMLLYPGGTVADPESPGYDFFRNFFSDLGRTVSPGGEPNTASALLFFVALTVAGLGLASYFVAALQFFWQGRLLRVLGFLGAVAGLASGLSFVGVALTPANLRLGAHGWFVGMAFRTFLAAVLFHLAAILLHRLYPKVYAAVYGVFAALLAAYLWLLFEGPRPGTTAGVTIQATGQKIIVYAALLCVLVQSYGTMRLYEAQANAAENRGG
ncbi:MAG: hypothetical protein M8467_16490 [Anaerolineae bacterium]|nr:hypothetical protein [Anaerolineae bacterium]